MITGDVSRIYQSGLVDGPGNRLVIYLQGCNFRCLNCHNPQTVGKCIVCGLCEKVCENGALRIQEDRRIHDPSCCKGCDRCLDECPVSANPQEREYSPSELLAIVRKYQAFVDGITFSGGEPSLQWRFVKEVAEGARTLGMTIYLDSNGYAEREVWKELIPVIDGVMLDIKALGSTHRWLTGMDSDLVLESARLLAQHGKLYHVRHLVIPGVTDNREEFRKLAETVYELGMDADPPAAGSIPLVLLPFRPHGVRGEFASLPPTDSQLLRTLGAVASKIGIRQVIERPLYT